MNYCQKCGAELTPDADCCPSCGASITLEAGKGVADKTLRELTRDLRKVGGNALQAANFDAEGEEPSFTLAGVKINLSLVIKALAAVLCVLFFLPLFKVNCSGMEISFTGINAAFGKTIDLGLGEKNRTDSNIFALLLFLIPAALFALHQFKEKSADIKNNLTVISLALSAAGLVSYIVFAVAVNKKLEGGYGIVKANFTFFYGLAVVLWIISGLLALLLYMSKKKRL